ncbi:MAG TPA: response regulator [Blastocatellia bacterium]|nr:response regulator [Blastocatellia bacterium]
MSKDKRFVLYVDDETVNLQLFRLTFQNEFEIVTTDTPAEAIRLLGEKEYEVIVSDMKMPKMTGIEFLTKAKDLQPDSHRILVTGLLEDESIESAIEGGVVNSIVHKPWIKSEFMEILIKD